MQGASFEDTSMGRITAELIAGGISGVVSWGSAVPLDVINPRSRGQNHRNAKIFWRRRLRQKLYAREGWAAFTRGALPVVLRSFPVNAVTFMVYERVLDLARMRWDDVRLA